MNSESMADVPSSSGYSALLNGENLVGRSVEQLLSKIQVVYLSEKRPQNDDGHNWMTIPLQGLEVGLVVLLVQMLKLCGCG